MSASEWRDAEAKLSQEEEQLCLGSVDTKRRAARRALPAEGGQSAEPFTFEMDPVLERGVAATCEMVFQVHLNTPRWIMC